MPLIATTLHTASAEALVRHLPTPAPLAAALVSGDVALSAAAYAGDAVVSSFVGAVSADLALVLADLDRLTAVAGTDSPLVSVLDVVRPALEQAADTLGAGVLAEGRRESASALFADPDTVVFQLSASGATAGWFAVRVREDGTVGAPSRSALHGAIAPNLGRINNVEMALTVEIGRTRMSVRDVLGLEPGSVVELDRAAGAPADILLNGRMIAQGEVVVVDQDYAVRITRILDIADGI